MHEDICADVLRLPDLLLRSTLCAAGFPAIGKWFLPQGHRRFGHPASRGGLQQPVGGLLLLPPQSLEEPMHVIILFGAQLTADAPDFFDGGFLVSWH
jgi:hypothetical protein